MSQVVVSIQTMDGRKDMYLRGVVGDMCEENIVAKVKEMLSHPDAHNLSRVKAKSPWDRKRKKTVPALRGDEEEQIPGTVDTKVEKALDTAELAAA